ncbi:kinase-like domain-containing protein [Ilyonectria robusta]|uniref:kinase-like domain-containing protein n=1 Tax=Ilyonectria robusta TaxID=1079257 RepID=UPI001E8EA634|nr:kinase-like domain-containing protein [Ilyonectria robusta]KAH8680242.1 kinase-like domain-containing protein [Ilyonectria robusta]
MSSKRHRPTRRAEIAPKKTAFHTLRNQLRRNLVRSESGRDFVPSASLDAIFTLGAIENAVEQLVCQPDDRTGLAHAIYNQGKKLFAILVWMQEPDAIVTFRSHDLLDRKLPFESSHIDDLGLKFAHGLVSDEQWKFVPYSFPPTMWECHREIDTDMVMPFVGKAEKVGAGMHADVYKVAIAPSEQAFYPKDSARVQIIKKSLNPNVEQNRVRQELLCLRLLNHLKHPNIVCMLGSYTQMEQHHFLFPCLDMDLSTFLKRDTRFGNFESDCTFYSALRGLGSALSHVHRLHLNQKTHGMDFDGIGWHHDIRPANVLVSKTTFLLTDFGLATFQQGRVKSKMLWQPTSGDYVAPECLDADQKEQIVDQAIDVWAFGCLLAEIVTYMEKGAAGVKEFSQHRLSIGRGGWTDSQFYDADGETKDLVKEWLGSLATNSVEERLIPSLVNTSLRAMTAVRLRRPRMMHIAGDLTLLSLKAHFYAVEEQFTDTRALNGITAGDNLWFLHERFRAWGGTLSLDKKDAVATLSDHINECYDAIIDNLGLLYQELEDASYEVFTCLEDRFCFEERVDRLVETLWCLLPINMQAVTKDYWCRAVLNADWTDASGDVYGTLKSRNLVYNNTDAAAAKIETVPPKVEAPATSIDADDENNSGDSPRLGNRARLALTLSTYIKDFNSIGWLQEGLKSQTMPFLKAPAIDEKKGDVSWRSYASGMYRSVMGAIVEERSPGQKAVCGTIGTQRTPRLVAAAFPSTATTLGLSFWRWGSGLL